LNSESGIAMPRCINRSPPSMSPAPLWTSPSWSDRALQRCPAGSTSLAERRAARQQRDGGDSGQQWNTAATRMTSSDGGRACSVGSAVRRGNRQRNSTGWRVQKKRTA
jgi:hypothetical protein